MTTDKDGQNTQKQGGHHQGPRGRLPQHGHHNFRLLPGRAADAQRGGPARSRLGLAHHSGRRVRRPVERAGGDRGRHVPGPCYMP